MSDGPLAERYLVRIVPQDRPIERLRIRLTEPREVPVHWKSDGRTAMLTARRVPPPKGTGGDARQLGELWDLRFGTPQTEPFELRGERISSSRRNTAVSLLAVEQAVQQHGEVAVRRRGTPSFVTENRGLGEVWFDADTSGDGEVVAVYRYEPLREVARPAAEAISIVYPKEPLDQPGAIAQSARVDSHYEASGRVVHRAQFQLHNRGLDHVTLAWPKDATLSSVWVDGQPASCEDGLIPLTASREYCEIVAEIVADDRPLSSVASRVLPAISLDVPSVEQRRICWLPPGYDMLRGMQPSTPSLSSRLFGDLGRASAQAPFDPLSSSAWARLVHYAPEKQRAAERVDGFLTQFGKIMTSADGGAESTWGQWISQGETAALEHGFLMLVDVRDLANAGFDPSTPTLKLHSFEGDSSPLECAITYLSYAGLVLITDGDTIVLTTSTLTDFQRRELSPLGIDTAWWVEPGRLQRTLSESWEHASPRFLRVGAWQQERNRAADAQTLAHREPPEPLAWTARVIATSINEPQEIVIVQAASVSVWSLAALLVSGVVVFWVGKAGVRWSLTVCGLVLLAALTVPAWLTPLTSSALIGSVIGCFGLAASRLWTEP
ncbi:MAG TPA: hypothetical protein VHV77_12225, partial [Pirellulales bacterium]|nr:hypothetical protein [Pirellulales bacterium]